MNFLLACAGGALGAGTRYLLAAALPSASLSWGVLVANIVGCALMGGLSVVPAVRDNPATSALLLTGFLGGLTTFSSFASESFRLERAMHTALYVGGSVAAGLLVFVLARNLVLR